MSHRVIEKRRRDRMNNCLADLSRLIPSSYLKKGRGRIEKTEIIEMAIKHMKHLQNHPCSKPEGCDLQNEIEQGLSKTNSVESFRVGYHECLTESMHFLVEKQGLYSGDPFIVRMMSHLQKHYDRLGRASTSEIHSTVAGTWQGSGLPSESREEADGRGKKDRSSGIKSEYGAVSEESGYASLMAEEESVAGGGEERRRREGEVGYSPERRRREAGRGISPERRRREGEVGYSPERRTREAGRGISPERWGREGEKSYSPERQGREGGRGYSLERKQERERELVGEQEREERYRRFTTQDLRVEGPEEVEEEPIGLYKFKSNIRQRFDMALEGEEGPSPAKRSRDMETEEETEARPLLPSTPQFPQLPEVKISASPGPTFLQPSSSFSLPKPVCRPVPIFALDPKGSFYVPLTVDLGLLNPFLHLLTEEEVGPFHPVTISVNFRRGVEAKREEERDWKGKGVIQKPSVIKHLREPC